MVGLDGVVAGGLPLGEVGGPEDAAAPRVDLAARGQLAGQDGLARCVVDEGELLGMVLVGAQDEGLFGGVRFVADLIDQDAQLTYTYRSE